MATKAKRRKLIQWKKGQMPFKMWQKCLKRDKNPKKGGSNALKNVAKCQKGGVRKPKN